MTPLADLIRAEIEQTGPIPFRRFMDLALYHPEHGYYASGEQRVGKEGDFITNVSVGPLFGRLLARYFVTAWEDLGRPETFDLVEIGAAHGQLFADVLDGIGQREPHLARALRCTIVEPFPRLRNFQQTRLSERRTTGDERPIRWVSNLQELPDASIRGVIWCNELFDALPVHRVSRLANGWAEMYVAHGPEGFKWSVGTATYDIGDAPAGFPISGNLPENYVTELWPHSDFWAGELARVIQKGRVVTIDYGFEAGDLYAEHRKSGTLQAYYRHKRSPNVLDHVGEQDITSHVNFTALIESGAQAGLSVKSFTTQERFLMEILKTMAADDFARLSDSEKKQFNTLVHPDLLGHVFKVLVQAKCAC